MNGFGARSLLDFAYLHNAVQACCASFSIPLFLTGFARKRQACQSGATVAQLICNQWVAGSIPVTGSMKEKAGQSVFFSGLLSFYGCRVQWAVQRCVQ